MINACDLAVAGVTQLQPYVAGKPIAELERELGINNIVKLASNENPLGPSSKVLTALANTINTVNRYPDGNGFILKTALAAKYQLATNQITLGNGSNDVLELIARSFVTASDEVLFSQYAFAVYPLVTQAIGAKAVIAPASNFGHDLAAMASLISKRTKLIFIANPNNPTGTYLTTDQLAAFISGLPTTTLVVLDEAYVEYGEQTVNTLDWLANHPNLIITRTFSKAYGLAGLRVGYALSDPSIAELLNRSRQPFNVNSLALDAATIALSDDQYIEQTKQANDLGKAQLIAGLNAIGLQYIPSKANFITVNVATPAEQIFEALLRQGLIIRPLANYGLTDYIRVSIGTTAENERFLAALRSVV